MNWAVRRRRPADRHRRRRRRLADVEHALDRRDPADRVLRERPAVGERADELFVDVDRAPAHAGDDSGLLESPPVDAREDQVLLRGVALEHADDLDVEPLDARAVAEIREPVAASCRRPALSTGKISVGGSGDAAQRADRQRRRRSTRRKNSPHDWATTRPRLAAAFPLTLSLPICYGRNRCSRTVFQPVTTENLPGQPSILSFFSEAGSPTKVVLGILLLFSFVCWVIIFAKFIRLRRVSRQSEKFVAFFRKSKRFSEVNTFAGELSDTPSDDPLQSRLRGAGRPGEGQPHGRLAHDRRRPPRRASSSSRTFPASSGPSSGPSASRCRG